MVLNDERYSLVDANIWVGYFDKDDSLSGKAKKIINSFERSSVRLIVTDFVIQEVVTVLLYKNKPAAIKQFLRYIHDRDNIEIVSIDTEFWNQTTRFIEENNFKPKLSFTDWSLLFLNQHFDLDLVTFDKQLKNAGQQLAF